MLKKIGLFILLCVTLTPAFSLGVVVNYCRFNTANQTPYTEFYISVIGNSIQYQKKGEVYQGSVEFMFLLKNPTTNAVIYADKFNLFSPNLKDTGSIRADFVFTELKRMEIANGKYKLEIQAKDNLKPQDVKKMSADIEIAFDNKEIAFSDANLLANFSKTSTKNKFSKAGYDLYPQPNGNYGNGSDTLAFYVELYNSAHKIPKDMPMLITITIGSRGSNKVLEKYVYRVKKTATDAPIPILHYFPIPELITQSYYLAFVVQDKDQNIVAQMAVPFYRQSDKADKLYAEKSLTKSVSLSEDNIINSYPEKQLDMYIDALAYISDDGETAFSHALSNVEEKRKFLYNFWLKRNESDDKKSMAAWIEYKQRVDLVNDKFKSQLRKGYLTDRGRVALKYGLPNDIQMRPREANTLPHEIWYYYKLKTQANVRFVFYDKDFVTNELRLLHSDLFGELQNSRWELMLRSTTINPNVNNDVINTPGNYGTDNNGLIPRRKDDQ